MKKLFTILIALILLFWSQAFADTIYNAPDGARTGAQMDADSTLAFPLDDQTNDYYSTLATLLDWVELQDATFTGTLDFSGSVNISGTWKYQDDICSNQGTDADICKAWDSADSVYEFRTSGGTPTFWWDLANKSANGIAVANPTMNLYDVDAAGTARTDEWAAGWDGNLTTVTEDATVGDLKGSVPIASVKSTFIEVDGSDEAIVLGDSVSGEDLKFDFETATDNGVTVSSNSGVTVVDFSAINLATTGTISGGSLTPVTDSTADFAANFTGVNLYGGTFVANADDGDLQLPLMVVGMNFCVITLGAIEVVADTNVADGYLMDGTTGVEGANITNLSVAGDIACFQYYTADDWLITTNGWTPE